MIRLVEVGCVPNATFFLLVSHSYREEGNIKILRNICSLHPHRRYRPKTGSKYMTLSQNWLQYPISFLILLTKWVFK
jgi:hypothetical protein